MMKTVFFIFCLCFGCLLQAQTTKPLLTKKGEWMLYHYKSKFGCKFPITFRIPAEDNKNLEINCESCSKTGSPDELNYFARLFFNTGLVTNNGIATVSIDIADDNRYVFYKKKNQLDLVPKDKFTIQSYKFKLNNNGSYQVKYKDSVYFKQFNAKWFENCTGTTDSQIVVMTKIQAKNNWYLKTECKTHYLNLNKQREPVKPGAKSFELECLSDSSIITRKIILFSDSTFHWEWNTTGNPLICAGHYQMSNDSLLTLNWNEKLTEYFMEDYIDEHPDARVIPKILINKIYVYRDEKIFFVNPYKD